MNKEKVINYLIHEKKDAPKKAEERFIKISKYPDIYSEFLKWLDVRNYNFENPVQSEGYSAQEIFSMAPFLDGIGVYNFLISLRDEPEIAKEIINHGFEIE